MAIIKRYIYDNHHAGNLQAPSSKTQDWVEEKAQHRPARVPDLSLSLAESPVFNVQFGPSLSFLLQVGGRVTELGSNKERTSKERTSAAAAPAAITMMSSLMGRRRGKAPSRDRGGERSTRNTGRLDSLDMMEGLGLDRGHGHGGLPGDKVLIHKEWTKEQFPDDFDDEDLE